MTQRNSGEPAAVDWRDLSIAAVVAAVSLVALALSDEPGARSPDTIAISLLLAMAVLLAFRRRWPTAVVTAIGVLVLGSFLAGYPGGPPALPLLVALYTIAAAGHRWWTVGVTVIFAGGGLLFRAMFEEDPPVAIALDSLIFVLVALLGDAVHTRQRLVTETRERLRLVESERDAEASRRVTEERLRIARELHDIMAHTITTMSVQAGAALDSLDRQPQHARAALTAMRSASRQAMQELRATVSLLRSSAPDDVVPREPTPGLEQLDELIDRVKGTGLDVDHHLVGVPAGLPPALQLTAFRVVQEGLTNVIRHSTATSVKIRLARTDGNIRVQIDDNGNGMSPGLAEGFGLRGLRERVDAVGGTMTTGPAPSGGFRLRADLPYLEDDR